MWAKLALKLFSREFKRGELTVISAAIALAVLTVLTLSMVTDRIGQSIEEVASLETRATDSGNSITGTTTLGIVNEGISSTTRARIPPSQTYSTASRTFQLIV